MTNNFKIKTKPKKSWCEKLNDPSAGRQGSKDLPKVVRLNQKAQKHWGGKIMVVPSDFSK